MNNIEKIRAEIERLLNKKWKWQSSIEGKFRCETYRELLQFIDSLPKDLLIHGNTDSYDNEDVIDADGNQKWSIIKEAANAVNWFLKTYKRKVK